MTTKGILERHFNCTIAAIKLVMVGLSSLQCVLVNMHTSVICSLFAGIMVSYTALCLLILIFSYTFFLAYTTANHLFSHSKRNCFVNVCRIKQINKPRPVSVDDMEAIFKEAKEAQEQADQAFVEEQQREGTIKSENLNVESNTVTTVVTESFRDSKPKSQSGKASAKGNKLPAPGSTVRVVSGTFAEFLGTLKKVNRKTRKVSCFFHINYLIYRGYLINCAWIVFQKRYQNSTCWFK